MMNQSNILHFQTHTSKPSSDWILFVHGAGGSTRTWRKQIEAFQDEYNLLLIDLPGHANSSIATAYQQTYNFEWIGNKIWEVVDFLNIEKLHIVAVSLGSIIAMQMHYNRPQAVKSLVFAGPIVSLNRKLRMLASTGLMLARIVGFQKFYAITARITLPRKNHKKSREIFVRESKSISDSEYRKWTAMYGKSLDNTLELLFSKAPSIPMCFVIGDQDHLFKAPAMNYATTYGNVHVELVPRCGHLVSLEKPLVFNEKCLRFLSIQA
jgi:pimeloyl-ACP methyl ester carboxylesterase